jgi:hypothetical protein
LLIIFVLAKYQKKWSYTQASENPGRWADSSHLRVWELLSATVPYRANMVLHLFQSSYLGESKFSENKYFSEAPLPTDRHMALLEEFEAGMKRLRA